ncbi:hypothetical protein DFJ74DRAFT_709771 [Hyaloraphidium curvatum]|nr:hypothetical protein DFJ74DRAFT_709771 [Hyaloraphidium curvatum]
MPATISTGKVPPPSQLVPSPPSFSSSILMEGTPQRRLVVSGQVGSIPGEGAGPFSVPSDYSGQVQAAYRNVASILEANGMGWADAVRTGVFIVAGATAEETTARIVEFRRIRDGILEPVFKNSTRGPPASTLLVVAALAAPNLLFEIEVEAVA